MKNLFGTVTLALTVLAGLTLAGQAAEAPEERIAAIVNDEVISTSDLENRLRLALEALNLPESPDTRDRLVPQLIGDLVNERLQLQEADRLEIEVSNDQIADAFRAVAEQNGMTDDEFIADLNDKGIPPSTLVDQIHAQLAWSRVVQTQVRGQIDITERDVTDALERLKRSAGRPEFLLAEIFLPVDTPGEDSRVRALAERLVDQIRQGANFPAIALQFSQAAGASRGGDLGWVPGDQLSNAVREVVTRMPEGSISPPIRDIAGYRIMLLRGRRTPGLEDALIDLRQLFVPVDPGSDPDFSNRAQLARQLDQEIASCSDMERVIDRYQTPMSGDLGELKLSDMPSRIREVIENTPTGRLSPPLMRDDGMLLLMVCDSEPLASDLPSRDQIANQLGMERMEVLQRRYIRDLRSAAFVEIRI